MKAEKEGILTVWGGKEETLSPGKAGQAPSGQKARPVALLVESSRMGEAGLARLKGSRRRGIRKEVAVAARRCRRCPGRRRVIDLVGKKD